MQASKIHTTQMNCQATLYTNWKRWKDNREVEVAGASVGEREKHVNREKRYDSDYSTNGISSN
jgi:hypothetical protein